MKFRYAKYGTYHMPIIPVTISRGERCIVTEALVDSGAANCIFDAQIADLVGIHDISAGPAMEFEGVSGHRLIGYCHPVTLEIGGVQFPPVTVAFTEDMPDNAVNILGQQGFFELCPIKFTYRIKEIDIMTGSMRSAR